MKSITFQQCSYVLLSPTLGSVNALLILIENFERKSGRAFDCAGVDECWDLCILVGGIATPLKNMSSSVGMMIPNFLWKNNPVMFQSPPTSRNLSKSAVHRVWVQLPVAPYGTVPDDIRASSCATVNPVRHQIQAMYEAGQNT